MAELSEVWTAILKVIAEDAKVLGLGVKASSVYYAEPGALLSDTDYPSIRMMVISSTDSAVTSDIGNVNARLQIDVFGVDQAINHRIADRLNALLDVPRRRPIGFKVCGFNVQSFKNSGGRKTLGKTGVQRDGAEVVQVATDWTLRAKHSF